MIFFSEDELKNVSARDIYFLQLGMSKTLDLMFSGVFEKIELREDVYKYVWEVAKQLNERKKRNEQMQQLRAKQ